MTEAQPSFAQAYFERYQRQQMRPAEKIRFSPEILWSPIIDEWESPHEWQAEASGRSLQVWLYSAYADEFEAHVHSPEGKSLATFPVANNSFASKTVEAIRGAVYTIRVFGDLHYRLGVEGAAWLRIEGSRLKNIELGYDKRWRTQPAVDQTIRWRVKILDGEELSLRIRGDPPHGSGFGNIQLRDPSGKIILETGPQDGFYDTARLETNPFNIPSPIEGQWSITLSSPAEPESGDKPWAEHYMLEKLSGRDRDLYLLKE